MCLLPIIGTSVLTKPILYTKNIFKAEILLKNEAKFFKQGESYNMIRTICLQHEYPWFLEHKDQLPQAGLDVNAKDQRGLTVLENILASDSREIEIAGSKP